MASALACRQVNISLGWSKLAREGGSLGSVIARVSALLWTEDCGACLWLANWVLRIGWSWTAC